MDSYKLFIVHRGKQYTLTYFLIYVTLAESIAVKQELFFQLIFVLWWSK